MEKYTRVYHFNEPLYIEGSPLVILAGAVLKDNETNDAIAQLKFQSITDKVVKALEVELVLYDSAGEKQEKKVNHEYLDLKVSRNAEFGSQEPIDLPYSNSRSFDVTIKRVVYADGDVWTNNKKPYKLEGQDELTTVFDAMELEFFQKMYGKTAELIPLKGKDVWMCTCGSINLNEDNNCAICKASKKDVLNLDFDEIKKEALYDLSDSYLKSNSIKQLEAAVKNFDSLKDYEDSKKKSEEATKKIKQLKVNKAKKEKEKKKITRFLYIILVVLAAFLIVFFFIVPTVMYRQAVNLYEKKDYAAAIEKFNKLPARFNSKEQYLEKSYINYAKELASEDKYEEAIKLLEEMPIHYIASMGKNAYIKGYYVDYAKKLVVNNQYDKAITIYEKYEMFDERLSAIIKYGKYLYDSGEYERAYEQFNKVSSTNDTAATWEKDAAIKAGDKQLEKKEYSFAINWYQKAKDKAAINKGKYAYVVNNKNEKDGLTYDYLRDLVKAKYKDSLNIYHSLYKVQCKLVLNRDKNDTKSAPTKYNQELYQLYAHYYLTSNIPTGEVLIDPAYETKGDYGDWYVKDSNEVKYTISQEVNKWGLGYMNPFVYNRVKIYNADTGELLCSSKTVHTKW